MTEEWRQVSIFTGPFEVSSLGRVRRTASTVASCYGSVASLQCRPLVGTLDPAGYRRVKLSFAGRKKSFGVHVLVASAFIDNPQRLPHVNHIDFNRSNNAVYNLEWCSAAENNRHTITHGRARYASGSDNGMATPVTQIDPISGDIVAEFSTATDAAAAAGVHLSNLLRATTTGGTCGGYRWSRRLIQSLKGEP